MWRESGSGNHMMNGPLPLHPEKPLPSPREPKKFQPERLQDQKNFLIIIRLKTPAQTAPP
jgi:hypothetical protein